jgi:hypothetical protein
MPEDVECFLADVHDRGPDRWDEEYSDWYRYPEV